jgi:hypothetical protein
VIIYFIEKKMKNKTLSLMVLLLVIFGVSAFAQDHLMLPNAELVRRYSEKDELIPNAVLARMVADMDPLLEELQYILERKPRTELRETNLRNIDIYIGAYTYGGRKPVQVQERQLYGDWIDGFPAPDYAGKLSIISNGNSIEVNDPLSEGVYKGKWEISNGFIHVTITTIQNASGRWITLQNPLSLDLPIMAYENFRYDGKTVHSVQIGYTIWYGGPR